MVNCELFVRRVLAICALSHPLAIQGSRILYVIPTVSKSHLIVHTAIAKVLSEGGHNVTVIATYPNPDKSVKMDFIYLDNVPNMEEISKAMLKSSLIVRLYTLVQQLGRIQDAMMQHPKMQQFLQQHRENSFDLLILGYILNDSLLGLSTHFKSPTIFAFPVQPVPTLNQLIGNPLEVAYVPSILGALTQPMNFGGRMRNFISSLYGSVMGFFLQVQQRNLYNKYFPSHLYPTFEEAKNNLALVFVNHHFSQGPIRPNVPAVIEIGGIQVKEKNDPLPDDLAKVLNKAKNGFIYFSLGTVVQEESLTMEKGQIIFNVLSSLPYTVLWKWDEKFSFGTAPNIIYRKWLPQHDLMAHPNLILFITHGGLGSMVEAHYHGVPMVGMPLFSDQPFNVEKMVNAGCGKSINFHKLNEQELRATIMEVVQNSTYRDAAFQYAKIYRDRPMTARETVLYWSEYVIRHRGAKHLQSPLRWMGFIERNSLDVLGAFALILVIIVLIIKAIGMLCCTRRKATHMAHKVNRQNKKSKQMKREEGFMKTGNGLRCNSLKKKNN